jgi:glutaredoxin
MVKKVQILKTPGCAACAQATVLVRKIKESEGLDFEIEEVDVTEHPDLLQKYQLMISPGIVVDGVLEFAGMPNEKKLRERLTE